MRTALADGGPETQQTAPAAHALRPPVSGQDHLWPQAARTELMQALHASRELLLVSLFLYQHLPHYVSKATVSFAGGLHEPLARAIELSNPAKKPIVYEVRLEGAPCFRVTDTQVKLEGRTS